MASSALGRRQGFARDDTGAEIAGLAGRDRSHSTEGFQSLLRAVGDGWCWAKLSGAHRISRDAPDYPDARPFHEALVRANPERLVWGGDWPHPRVEGEMPDAGHLFELFQMWTPDRATQQRILVTNPATLYGFPN
jgi:2-pyrone-4,6-dicarboxylate lactonase